MFQELYVFWTNETELKMIGDKYDIHCEKCGKYLFTAEEIPYENGDESSLGKEIRLHDHKDYLYTEDGKFVCNKCQK